MRGKRQNIQYSLALDPTGRGESPLGGHQGTEPPVAKPDPESPALAEPLLRLNPDEPPWYGPVCPVVWEGWHREVPPYPDQDGVCGELDYVAKFAESSGPIGADGKDHHIVEQPTETRGRPSVRCRRASVVCDRTRKPVCHRRTFAGLWPSSPDLPRRSDSLSQGTHAPTTCGSC